MPAVFTIYCLVAIWYIPFSLETFQWVYRTSFGDVAANTGDLTHSMGIFGIIHSQIKAEGQMAVIASVVLATISFAIMPVKQKFTTIASKQILYLILIIPIPLLEVLFTIQSTPRKLSVAFPAFIMSMLIIGLRSGRALLSRIIIMMILLLMQIVLLYALLTSNDGIVPNNTLNNLIGYLIPQPVRISPNPHDVVYKFLDSESSKYNLHNIAVQVDPNPHMSTLSNPVDPFLISAMMNMSTNKTTASYPYFSNYSEENINSLSKGYDGLFLSDYEKRMLSSPDAASIYQSKFDNENDASLKSFYKLLLAYAQDNINMYGWNKGPCIEVNSSNHEKFKGCLFISNKSPNSIRA